VTRLGPSILIVEKDESVQFSRKSDRFSLTQVDREQQILNQCLL
jgi:hypothetical protein